MFDKIKKSMKVKSKAIGNVGKKKVKEAGSGLVEKSKEVGSDVVDKGKELYQEYKQEEKKIRDELRTSRVDKDTKFHYVKVIFDANGEVVRWYWNSKDDLTTKDLLNSDILTLENGNEVLVIKETI